jgi:hypothetical protein
MGSETLRIYYHRDFDGMVSAAVLACILQERGEAVDWESVNYDQRRDWKAFGRDRRFAIVDFHFHPRAEFWFDHHPTTFLTPELRAQYAPSDRWRWDESSPSCPPLILSHAHAVWGYEPPERFVEMARWSDVVDAALFESVDQALFGDDPALRITRSLTCAPGPTWPDEVVGGLVHGTLEEVAARSDVERAYQRAARNRDRALEQFPPTVRSAAGRVVHYDASSNKIRRERFAPFFHHPEAYYTVGVIPTRAGFHVSAGQNPWNQPSEPANIGAIMERYGGGGHRAVGGANPPTLDDARRIAREVAELLRAACAESAR